MKTWVAASCLALAAGATGLDASAASGPDADWCAPGCAARILTARFTSPPARPTADESALANDAGAQAGSMRPRQAPGRPRPAAASAFGLELPASFSGDLTCATCDRVQYRLNLWPDHVFALRRTWTGKETTRDVIGRWSVDAARGALMLRDGEERLDFRAVPPDRLLPVVPDGVAPLGEGELLGKPGITPLDLSLPIRGMVSFLADEARISECLTGRDYPLVAGSDFETLEAAYLAAGIAQGQPLMASFDGIIAQHRRDNGEGAETAVTVSHFSGVWPDETCADAMAAASLTNTNWTILRLDKTDITSSKGGREPALLLEDPGPRFFATVGCNQMIGTYARDGQKLRFRLAATTRMACPPPLDAWEQALGNVLASVAGWQVNGQALELLDETGMQVGLFQAKPATWLPAAEAVSP